MVPVAMAIYGRLCGWTLARAHARSGDRIAIAAYLGSGKSFDNAIAAFAETYADQNERDYDALKKAAAEGRITVESGTVTRRPVDAVTRAGRDVTDPTLTATAAAT